MGNLSRDSTPVAGSPTLADRRDASDPWGSLRTLPHRLLQQPAFYGLLLVGVTCSLILIGVVTGMVGWGTPSSAPPPPIIAP